MLVVPQSRPLCPGGASFPHCREGWLLTVHSYILCWRIDLDRQSCFIWKCLGHYITSISPMASDRHRDAKDPFAQVKMTL